MNKIEKINKNELEQLTYIFKNDSEGEGVQLPSSIFLWGPRACGKSTTLLKALKSSRITFYSEISATQLICGQEEFLQNLIAPLLPSAPPPISSPSSFIYHFRKLVTKELPPSTPILLIIKRAELLRENYESILFMLLKCQELTRANVCSLFLSRLPWSFFVPHATIGHLTPLDIQFKKYKRSEMGLILFSAFPLMYRSTEGSKKQLGDYINTVLSIYYDIAPDLRQMKRVAFENYTHDNEEKDVSQSFISNKVKLKINQGSLTATSLKIDDLYIDSEEDKIIERKSGSSLAKYERFMLLAAYLASENPKWYDVRLFVKERLGKTNSGRSVLDHEKSVSTPYFTYYRLLAIFSSLTELRQHPPSTVDSIICNLLNLGLISVQSPNCTNPKFKSHVRKEVAESVSKSLGIPSLKFYLLSAPSDLNALDLAAS